MRNSNCWEQDFTPPRTHNSSHFHSRRNRWLGGDSYINYWWCDTCPFLLAVTAWDENYYSVPVA